MIELFVNDQSCPIKDQEKIAITRAVSDISQPTERIGDYAKGFVLLGTPETNKLLGQIFEFNSAILNDTDINFTPDFNPNLKATAVVYAYDHVVFRGDMMLRDIEITRENKIEYIVEVFASIGNFFQDIGESLMIDLDISDLDNTWDSTTVAASFSNDYTDGYVYPMIDYGTNSDKRSWDVTDFRPAVFIKYLWDKIFANVNWGYTGDFLETDDFEKLIMVGSGKPPAREQSDINNDTFTVAYTAGSQTLSPAQPNASPGQVAGIFDWDDQSGTVSGNILKNTSNSEFSLSNDSYFANQDKGKMMFRFRFDSTVRYLEPATLSKDEVATVTYIITVGGPARGAAIKVLDSFVVEYDLPAGTMQNGLSNTVEVSHTTIEHEIFHHDRVDIRMFTALSDQFPNPLLTPTSRFNVVIGQNSIFGNIPRTELWIGQTMRMNALLPREMKQRDFIMAIVKMFNLYIEQSNERQLLVEPRDNGYHLSGDENVLDFTDKLDISSPYKIKPMGFLNTRRYLFSYTQGKDYHSRRYEFIFNRSYGDKIYNVQNDFQTNDKNVTIPFATAPLVNDQNQNDRILTSIQFFDDSGGPSEPSDEVRVLYYGGAVTTANKWYFRGLFGLPGGVGFTQYPYAGHLNDPNNPTADYLFSFPRAVFYDIQSGGTQATKYTNNNLFNRFYSKMIFEITNKDSKVLEGWFYIDTATWDNISFRKLYWIKDSYWRLLEISDYDVSGNSLTFCKFLKTDFVASQATESGVTIGGAENWTVEINDPQPLIFRDKFRDLNTTRTGLDRNHGFGNAVQGTKGIVRGDLNVIGASTEGYALLNASGNQISGKNAVLMNTSDRYVPWDDQIWFNNIHYENKLVFEMDNTIINALDTTPLELLPDLASNQYWQVRGDIFLDHNGTNYAGGNLLVETTTSGIDLLDDSSNPISAEAADMYAQLDDVSSGLLTSRLGEGVHITANPAIINSGGPVTLTLYAKIIEV